jgi:hypothetical protein
MLPWLASNRAGALLSRAAPPRGSRPDDRAVAPRGRGAARAGDAASLDERWAAMARYASARGRCQRAGPREPREGARRGATMRETMRPMTWIKARRRPRRDGRATPSSGAMVAPPLHPARWPRRPFIRRDGRAAPPSGAMAAPPLHPARWPRRPFIRRDGRAAPPSGAMAAPPLHPARWSRHPFIRRDGRAAPTPHPRRSLPCPSRTSSCRTTANPPPKPR